MMLIGSNHEAVEIEEEAAEKRNGGGESDKVNDDSDCYNDKLYEC